MISTSSAGRASSPDEVEDHLVFNRGDLQQRNEAQEAHQVGGLVEGLATVALYDRVDGVRRRFGGQPLRHVRQLTGVAALV